LTTLSGVKKNSQSSLILNNFLLVLNIGMEEIKFVGTQNYLPLPPPSPPPGSGS